jgi:hypothetical protein
MNPNQHSDVFVVLNPAAKVNNASAATKVIDLAEYGSCDIYVVLGDTDVALTALKVQESDSKTDSVTLGGTPSDVPGTVVGTDKQPNGTASALPTAGDDNKVWKFEVRNHGGRKRYIKPVVTVGNGTTGAFVTVLAVLHQESVSRPDSAADRGLACLMRA